MIKLFKSFKRTFSPHPIPKILNLEANTRPWTENDEKISGWEFIFSHNLCKTCQKTKKLQNINSVDAHVTNGTRLQTWECLNKDTQFPAHWKWTMSFALSALRLVKCEMFSGRLNWNLQQQNKILCRFFRLFFFRDKKFSL